MYIPPHFEETRLEVLHSLLRAYPLAAVVVQSPGGLEANHIPLHLHVAPDGAASLHGHIARANPLASMIGSGIAALAIFQGPAAYISPSWYPAKQEHGRVVPTWNYVAVHAHGTLRLVEDAEWLRQQLDALTAHNEAAMPQPWAVSDAPAAYVAQLMKAIVGIELPVTALTGKWKASQNHPAANQQGAIDGLKSLQQPQAAAMAALMEHMYSQKEQP